MQTDGIQPWPLKKLHNNPDISNSRAGAGLRLFLSEKTPLSLRLTRPRARKNKSPFSKSPRLFASPLGRIGATSCRSAPLTPELPFSCRPLLSHALANAGPEGEQMYVIGHQAVGK